jgi:branched-chain amino acid transport system ATP-binding protein
MVEQNAGVLSIADKAYVMEKGTLIFSGKGDEILNNQSIREAYLGA